MQRRSSIISVLLLLSAGTVSAQDFDPAGEQQMLLRINAMRAEQQLAPLMRHGSLDAAARAHAIEMAANRQLTHVSQTTGTPADRVRTAGLQATTISENVALHRSAEEAHGALLGSEAHRANMMSPHVTHAGFAALRSEQGVYITQVFAAIAAPAPEPPQRSDVVQIPAPQIPQIQIPPPAMFEPQPGIPQIEAPQVQLPPPQAQLPQAQAQAQGQPQRPNIAMQPGSNGTVLIQRANDGRVEAYWVYGSGRWWFYPMPTGAQGGQRLAPDMNVMGPPPGYPEHPFGAPQGQPQPFQPQAMMPRPQILAQVPHQLPPQHLPQQGGMVMQADPNALYYNVPPPPLVGQPDRAWRAAQRQWERAYQRWLRDQERARRRAL
jgi:hypothetical protein